MMLKDLRELIFQNHYKWVGFNKKDSNFLLKKEKNNRVLIKKDLILLKLKNTRNYFLKTKVKKIHKTSKTVKNPSNNNIRSVTVRHPKTASKQ